MRLKQFISNYIGYLQTALINAPADLSKSLSRYQISTTTRFLIMLAPLVMLILCVTGLYFKSTVNHALWLLEENHPVEILTFILLFTGSIYSAFLSLKCKKNNESKFTIMFYLFFAIALFIISMEEIAWGQWFLGFSTPDGWAKINRQGETTLHNIKYLQGRSEILRFTYAAAGILGIVSFYNPGWKRVAAPVILFPWFIIIIIHASIDIYNDLFPITKRFDFFFQRVSELIELMIATSACLYLWLNKRYISEEK